MSRSTEVHHPGHENEGTPIRAGGRLAGQRRWRSCYRRWRSGRGRLGRKVLERAVVDCTILKACCENSGSLNAGPRPPTLYIYIHFLKKSKTRRYPRWAPTPWAPTLSIYIYIYSPESVSIWSLTAWNDIVEKKCKKWSTRVYIYFFWFFVIHQIPTVATVFHSDFWRCLWSFFLFQ